MTEKKFENYEDYLKNRTVDDIMEEWGEHRDEWKPCGENIEIGEKE